VVALRVLAAASPPAVRTHGPSWEGWVVLLALVALAVFLLWRHKSRSGGRASAHAVADAAARAAGGEGGAGKGGDSRTTSALQVFVVLDRDSLSTVLASGRPAVELASSLGRAESALLPVDSVRSGGSLERGEGAADGLQLGQRGLVYQLGAGTSDSRDGDSGYVPAVLPSGGHRRAVDGVHSMTCASPECTFPAHHLGPCSWTAGSR
jgi:hypothetical protein